MSGSSRMTNPLMRAPSSCAAEGAPREVQRERDAQPLVGRRPPTLEYARQGRASLGHLEGAFQPQAATPHTLALHAHPFEPFVREEAWAFERARRARHRRSGWRWSRRTHAGSRGQAAWSRPTQSRPRQRRGCRRGSKRAFLRRYRAAALAACSWCARLVGSSTAGWQQHGLASTGRRDRSGSKTEAATSRAVLHALGWAGWLPTPGQGEPCGRASVPGRGAGKAGRRAAPQSRSGGGAAHTV